MSRGSLPNVLSPLFWIAGTFTVMTYGPVLFGLATGAVRPQDLTARLLEKSPAALRSVLGAHTSDGGGSITSGTSTSTTLSAPHTLPPIPHSLPELPQFFQAAVSQTTQQIIDKGNEQVTQTRQEVTKNVCSQIVKAIETQCGDVSTSQ